jgi:hypothetical protein
MRRVIGLAAGLMLVVSVAALAHWDPGGCYKMHYLQLPIDLVDPGSNGLDVSFAPPLRWADDWLCIESGYVTDIHLWVSWQGDQIQPIGAITVRIWSDNPEGPGGFSIPGALLFDRDLGPGDFVVRNMDDHLQDWFTPWTGDYFLSDHVLWQQINIVDIEDPFYQEEGNIYWLEIDVPVIETVGWKV